MMRKSALLIMSAMLAAAGLAGCRLGSGDGGEPNGMNGKGGAALTVEPLSVNPIRDTARVIPIDEERVIYVSRSDIFYQEGDKYYPIVLRGYPRAVGLSPDRQAFAFVEPAEFEQIGNLYVFRFADKSLRRLTHHERERGAEVTVKAVKWRTPRTLYFIEGYAFGTVSSGGSLYRVRSDGTGLKPVSAQSPPDVEPHVEVADFEFTPGKFIRLTLRVFEGSNEEPREETRYLDLAGNPAP